MSEGEVPEYPHHSLPPEGRTHWMVQLNEFPYAYQTEYERLNKDGSTSTFRSAEINVRPFDPERRDRLGQLTFFAAGAGLREAFAPLMIPLHADSQNRIDNSYLQLGYELPRDPRYAALKKEERDAFPDKPSDNPVEHQVSMLDLAKDEFSQRTFRIQDSNGSESLCTAYARIINPQVSEELALLREFRLRAATAGIEEAFAPKVQDVDYDTAGDVTSVTVELTYKEATL